MKRCYYCGGSPLYHSPDCRVNTRIDNLHCEASLEPERYYPEPYYGERLQFGFDLLSQDEDSIVDKFGFTHGSGIC